MRRYVKVVAVVSLLFLVRVGTAGAADIGTVVAVKGTATIERGVQRINARVKSGLQVVDTVRTSKASRIKMLFVDDSVLTLGDSSSMSLREFVHSKGERGKSVFNLIDGKMRAVVGKTRFEVRTPTAVAAARGTIIFFETGGTEGQRFTRIIAMEGVVDVHSALGDGAASVMLLPGMSIVVVEGQPLPIPIPATPADMERARQLTGLGGQEIKLLTPTLPEGPSTGLITLDVPYIVPMLEQQPPAGRTQPTSVTIGINF